MAMTTIEPVVALQRVALFEDVPGRTLAAVARRATELELGAGTPVIVEGAVEDHLFTVVSGRLRVHHGDRDSSTRSWVRSPAPRPRPCPWASRAPS